MSKRTNDKITILKKTTDLLKFFDPDCVLKEHGGTSDFVYTYKNIKVTDDPNAN